MSEENKALIQRFVEEAFNEGNLDAADEVYAPRLPLPRAHRSGRARPGVHQGVCRHLPRRFPGRAHHRRGRDRRGRQGGLPLELPRDPPGRAHGYRPDREAGDDHGITVDRISGSKIEEEWNNFDQLGVLRQLGVVSGQ